MNRMKVDGLDRVLIGNDPKNYGLGPIASVPVQTTIGTRVSTRRQPYQTAHVVLLAVMNDNPNSRLGDRVLTVLVECQYRGLLSINATFSSRHFSNDEIDKIKSLKPGTVLNIAGEINTSSRPSNQDPARTVNRTFFSVYDFAEAGYDETKKDFVPFQQAQSNGQPIREPEGHTEQGEVQTSTHPAEQEQPA